MGRITQALICSAILNVFLVGVGVGVLASGARITLSTTGKAKPFPTIWQAAEALPQPDRLKFMTMLRDQAQQVRPILKSVHAARLEAAALMTEPTFDASAVGAALERARTQEAQARGLFDAAFVSYLAAMPQPERTALSQGMMRAGPRVVPQAIRAPSPEADPPTPSPAAKLRDRP